MYFCEEDVIIASGLYLLAEDEKKRKEKKRKYWIHKVFRAREEEGKCCAVTVLLKHSVFRYLTVPTRSRSSNYGRFFSKFSNTLSLLYPSVRDVKAVS
jgi:hypothetical protein